MQDILYFAIGDVHGEREMLETLHAKGRAYAQAEHPELRLVFVHLGDLVDRGPDSYGVVEMVMNMHAASPDGMIAVKGNHEEWVVEHAADPHATLAQPWMKWGGTETLASYLEAGHETPPDSHIAFLGNLPSIHKDDARKIIFVHAGVHPVNYPDDDERIHLWSRRKDFYDVARWEAKSLEGYTVVHGHTPTRDNEPDIVSFEGRTRINVDTGACFGGKLSGVMLAPGAKPHFLHA